MLTRRLALYISLFCLLLLAILTYSAQVMATEQDKQSPDEWEILYADSQNYQTLDSVPAAVRDAQLEEQFVFQYADSFFVNALDGVDATVRDMTLTLDWEFLFADSFYVTPLSQIESKVRDMALLLDWEFLFADSFYVTPLTEIDSTVRNAPLEEGFVFLYADSFSVNGLQPPIEGYVPVTPTPAPSPAATDVPPSGATPLPATPTVETVDVGDEHEPDDGCAEATMMPTDGTIHTHDFHADGDEDWMQFTATAGSQYRVIGEAPINSDADLVVELYAVCDNAYVLEQSYTFAPGVRMTFRAETDTVHYIRVYNDPGTSGGNMTYTLSVRDLGADEEDSSVGAVIIVAGRQRSGDVLQQNIHNVTNNVYRLFKAQEYPESRIQYLATNLTLDPVGDGGNHVDAETSSAALESAITTWAKTRVSDSQALTIYLMSHGDDNQFYLNTGDTLSPETLDRWLDELEAAVPGLKVNVIIEACHAGSFIELERGLDSAVDTISDENRVVIASSATHQLAWASRNGALFSDYFLFGLRQQYTVYEAFRMASAAANIAPWPQTPWLDDNGNGIPNDPSDGLEAAVRGFSFPGTFSSETDKITEPWEPYVQSAEVSPTAAGVTVRARVADEKNDERETVWAVLYPPSYTPPSTDSTDFVTETLETVPLTLTESGFYEATLNLTEEGSYEAIIYARDEDGLLSRPRSIQFTHTGIPLKVTLTDLSTVSSSVWLLVGFGLMVGTAAIVAVRR